jgi:hypothetical protein
MIIKNAVIYVGPETKIDDCIYFINCTFITWGKISVEEMKAAVTSWVRCEFVDDIKKAKGYGK